MGKKMQAARTKVEAKQYSLKDAAALVKQAAYAKFDESVDLAIRLGIDGGGGVHAGEFLRN